MTVATGTLTVNAAFLREIKEDNRRLHELLDETMGRIASASHEASARDLVESLNELRDQLALHFSLEEAYGYFEDAVEVAPRLSERAEELRSQHGELFLALGRIVERAEQWLYGETTRDAMPAIDRQFRTFQRRLREHESRETALVMDAFEDDVGVGD